jgi:hypothetical protein
MNTLVQLILTYSILSLASGYVVYRLVRMIIPKKEEITGCGSGCGCDTIKLKKEILEINRKKAIS